MLTARVKAAPSAPAIHPLTQRHLETTPAPWANPNPWLAPPPCPNPKKGPKHRRAPQIPANIAAVCRTQSNAQRNNTRKKPKSLRISNAQFAHASLSPDQNLHVTAARNATLKTRFCAYTSSSIRRISRSRQSLHLRAAKHRTSVCHRTSRPVTKENETFADIWRTRCGRD